MVTSQYVINVIYKTFKSNKLIESILAAMIQAAMTSLCVECMNAASWCGSTYALQITASDINILFDKLICIVWLAVRGVVHRHAITGWEKSVLYIYKLFIYTNFHTAEHELYVVHCVPRMNEINESGLARSNDCLAIVYLA